MQSSFSTILAIVLRVQYIDYTSFDYFFLLNIQTIQLCQQGEDERGITSHDVADELRRDSSLKFSS